MKYLHLKSSFQYIAALAILVVCGCCAVYVYEARAQWGIVDDVPSPSLCSNGNVNNPSSYPDDDDFTTSLYGQSSYYRQGSYGGGYRQGSYSSYGQGSYFHESLTDDDDDDDDDDDNNNYSQGSYSSCPSGYRPYGGGACCPNQYYEIVDTNGSGKGGRVERCNIPAYSQGSYYNQSTYYLQSGYYPPISDVTLEVTPDLVRYGESTTVIWDGGNSESCTLKGYGIDTTVIQGEQVVADIHGESTYTLTCVLGPQTEVRKATVRILPIIQET